MNDTTHNSIAGEGHGSVKSYVVGLILSILLTVIPFGMVMNGGFSDTLVLVVIITMAVLQILVQLVFFLHMNASSDGGWNLASFAFTVLILGIVVAGSLWIMSNLHYNLMSG